VAHAVGEGTLSDTAIRPSVCPVSPRDNFLGSVMQCYFEFLVQAADINGMCYFYSNSVISNSRPIEHKQLIRTWQTDGQTDYMQQTVALRFTLWMLPAKVSR